MLRFQGVMASYLVGTGRDQDCVPFPTEDARRIRHSDEHTQYLSVIPVSSAKHTDQGPLVTGPLRKSNDVITTSWPPQHNNLSHSNT